MTTSASLPSAASFGEAELSAPSSTRGRVRSSRTSKTLSSKPAPAILFAMGDPIAPNPTNPRRFTTLGLLSRPAEGRELRLHHLLHRTHDAVAQRLQVERRGQVAELVLEESEICSPELGVDVELGYP